MGLSVCYGIVFMTTTLASCQPFSYYFHRWDSKYSGSCINVNAEISAGSIANIVLDFAVTMLPVTQMYVPKILTSGTKQNGVTNHYLCLSWTLQMNGKKKLTVSFIFLAGLLVTGISIARYVAFERASVAELSNFTCMSSRPLTYPLHVFLN